MLTLLLLLGAAAAPALPEPVGRPGWISYTDYPSDSIRREEQGTVWVELSVDATGKPYACRTLLSNASWRIESITCKRMMARGRFEPAQDADGAAIPGSYRTAASFDILYPPTPAEKPILARPVDAAIPVNHLPEGVLPDVEVLTLEDASGRVRHCAVHRSSKQEMLDRAACEAMTKAAFEPLAGPDGTPVPAVRHRAIEFRPAG